MARTWRCGRYSLPLDRPLVMGIVNVTPDSFSDGGIYADAAAAVAAGRAMRDSGAALLDVGGESTRPGSSAPSIAEEIARIEPVVAALAAEGAVVSIDTRHAEVALAALAAGASVLNDVSGFGDPAMVAAAADSDAGVVIMHMQGEPGTMQVAPHYDDVVAEVGAYLARQAAALVAVGVEAERIAIDPGIGFGKTTEHNLELLRRLPQLVALGHPVLVGASRKRFIGELTGVAEPRERLAGSLAVAVEAAARGAGVLRVHDVPETVQALQLADAIDPRARAYVGLGANLGDRLATMASALTALDRTPGVRVITVSHAYESEPWGIEDQPAFANAVAVIETTLGPAELLAALKRIEREAGRGDGPRNGPRVLDLDLELYGDQVVDEPGLQVPHPRLLERDFVVTPLLEVAPDVVLPSGERPDRARADLGRVVACLGAIPGFE